MTCICSGSTYQHENFQLYQLFAFEYKDVDYIVQTSIEVLNL